MSENTTHTPGPWKKIRSTLRGYEIVPAKVKSDVSREQIAMLVFKVADARIIAASPEMLAVLRRLVAWNNDANENGIGLESICDAAETLLATIPAPVKKVGA